MFLSRLPLVPLKSWVRFMKARLLLCEYCSIVTIDRSVCTSIVRPVRPSCGFAEPGRGGSVYKWCCGLLILLPMDCDIWFACCIVWP